ncbi:MAG: hypothetical protein ACFCU8_09400 [Thermosynechococcaceae cyanobacterium]
MDYLYSFSNSTLVLRAIRHLLSSPHLPTQFVSVIHQLNGWVLRVQTAAGWTEQTQKDFRAFLHELGVPYSPNVRVRNVLEALEDGYAPVEVMERYQIAVIAHGAPDLTEIQAFREQFIQGLGYCPETLA